MKRTFATATALSFAGTLGLLCAGTASAQDDPVAQRAIDGARAYVEENGLENPSIDILLNSLYRNSLPDYGARWKELTGLEIVSEPLASPHLPTKCIGEWD